jgi:hypothetical protein
VLSSEFGVGRSTVAISRIDLLHQSESHLGDLISLLNQRLGSISRQGWIEPLTEFQGGDDFFQRTVRKAEKPAELGIAGGTAPLRRYSRAPMSPHAEVVSEIVLLLFRQTRDELVNGDGVIHRAIPDVELMIILHENGS